MGFLVILFWSVFIIIFLAYVLMKHKQAKAIEAIDPENLPFFTLEELKKYNGKTDPKIYISLKNLVLDVTNSSFYKPDATYALFAGHEVSVALAKMTFDNQYFEQYGKVQLTQTEVDVLESWFSKLAGKYKVIGRILENKKDQ